ncbi:DUF4158 domain-containing protein [Nocardia brevicatena]|uniref:DUF4158 domain-containing protein n=1 Tax=Nocardia brevicatena TaxID=37327 RepID=UPI001FDEE383|nr:DUF4158 domain-containing protein [Nocardia brevicatena]
MRDEGSAGGYGRFGVLSRVELERFFHLDDEDHRLIASRRRDYNRLGFAVQLVTVRHLGMFLTDPLAVPPELVEYLAEQLGIEDPTCVKAYVERDKTRLEHAWEIQRAEELASFSEVEAELAVWIADQAWITGDGPKAIFDGAVAWQLDPASGRALQAMLVPRDEGRRKVIDLERLRRGVFKPSAKGLLTA